MRSHVQPAGRNRLKNECPVLRNGSVTFPESNIGVFLKQLVHVRVIVPRRKFFWSYADQDAAILHRSRHIIVKPPLNPNARLHFQRKRIWLALLGRKGDVLAKNDLTGCQPSHELENMSARGKPVKLKSAIAPLLPIVRPNQFFAEVRYK